jgi:hypothetical protein
MGGRTGVDVYCSWDFGNLHSLAVWSSRFWCIIWSWGYRDTVRLWFSFVHFMEGDGGVNDALGYQCVLTAKTV